jgi:anti-sigma B factor antagonist
MSASAPPDGPVLHVDSRPDGAAGWVVAADGEIDLATSPRLRAALLEAIEDQDRVLVDLRAVIFMDSTGIATLLAAAEAARGRGIDLAVDPSRTVRNVLELVGAEAVLQLRGESPRGA